MKNSQHFFNNLLIFLFILFLPTQLGRHFFLPFSYLSGVRIDYLAPTIYATDILAILLIIFNFKTVFNFFKNKKILVVLLSLLIFNLLISQSQIISLYRYIKILEWLSVFSIFASRATPCKEKIVFYGFFWGAFFELILVVLQFINKHSIQGIFWFFGERYLTLSMPGIAKAAINGIEFLRPYGTFSHPNSMGGFYLLLYFFVLLFISRYTLRVARFTKQLFLLICTFLIFFSFSKIAIVTFLISNVYYLISIGLKKKIFCKPCFLAKIIVPIFVALIFLFAKTDPQTVNNRIILIKNSWQVFISHPFFGVGLGNYLTAQNKIPLRFNYFFQQPVHNIFLLWITETGIVTTGLILFFVINFFKKIKKPIAISYYLLAIVFITGFFDHYWLTLQQNFLLLAVILGIVFVFPNNL